MVSKVLKSLVVVSTLVCAQMAQALPLSLTSNSTYSLSGTGLGAGEALADAGTLFLVFSQSPHGSAGYQAGDLYASLDLKGSLNTGNISNNILSSLDVQVTSSLVSLFQYDGTAWNQVNGATGSASYSSFYEDVTMNSNRDTFAAIKGTAVGTKGLLTLDLSFGGTVAQISEDLKGSFMPFDQASAGYYSTPINAFSNNGILDFAMAGFNGGIHSWFEGYTTVAFGGKTYYLQGDAHGNYSSEVPEPASMGLLTAGLLGVIGRRRKKVTLV